MDSRQVLPAGVVLDGKYRIERVLGAGGFGITYAAHDLGLSTTVALKEYYPSELGVRDRTMSVRAKSDNERSLFERLRVSFVREARTLAKFRHPSIVRVLSVFEAHGTAYMAMEFEDGRSLKSWMRNRGEKATQEDLDGIFMPLLDALETLHQADFLHRDIAPDNIIIRDDGSPVLLDFGAARRVIAEQSGQMTGLVKQGYSPQEQYSTDAKAQGPWTDIYALGATLYHVVMGRAPMEATVRIIEDTVKPAAQAEGNYRREFLAGIDAAIAVRPENRPRSIAELRPLLFGEVLPAPRTSPTRLTGQPPAQAAGAAVPTSSPRVDDPEAVSPPALFATPHAPAPARSNGMLQVGIVASLLAAGAFGVYAFNMRGSVADFARPATTLPVTASNNAQTTTSPLSTQASIDIAAQEAAATARRQRELSEAAQRDEQARREREQQELARREETRREQERRDATRRNEDRSRQADEGLREAIRLVNGQGGATDQAKARPLFEAAAQAGRVEAMAWLGRMHLNGLGVIQDNQKAAEWFGRAAEAGDVASMAQLGLLYQNGQGVEQNQSRAREWLEKAANAGHVQSIHNLGTLYHNGQGAAQDLGRAREYFEKAANAGNVQSMLNLGLIYKNGVGLAADPAKAREWYEKAAATGHASAMNQVGIFYQDGTGVAKDPAVARNWFERSVAGGNTVAVWNLARMLNGAQGGDADYTRAAKLLLQANQAGIDPATRDLAGKMERWHKSTRTEVKRELQRVGLYKGVVNDVWDDAARKAVTDYRARPR